jgi:hypothetical protein
MSAQAIIRAFFDEPTNTVSYLVADPATKQAPGRQALGPRLLLPSIQVNIRGGRFPPAQANGVHYLTIPVKLKGGAKACV